MTLVSLEPVVQRPSSLTDIAFDRIRDAITSKSLTPGMRVSESMLSDMLQVSKTPVREALLRLCHIGLVEPTTGGLRVVTPSTNRIRDVYALRSALEFSAVREACVRATDEERAAILEAAEQSLACAKADDGHGFYRWDLAFHNAIAAATGNQIMAKAIGEALVLSFTLRTRDTLKVDDSVYCAQEHVAIARSIISGGDADKVGELMSTHINGAMRIVLDAGPSELSAGVAE